MSKRSDRRAAERTAHKANRPVVAQAAIALPVPIPEPIGQPMEKAFAATASASEAQIHANRENAQHSTGPTSEAGKQKVSQNRRTHGLSGQFFYIVDEDPTPYLDFAEQIYSELKPQSDTEARLADSLIQHYWLMQRAIRLQNQHISDDKKLALFLRYQVTHERSYYKAQKDLMKLQKERAKEQIGFESQNRTQEAHQAKVRLTHARAQNLEIDTACRQVMEAPLPGNYRMSFEQIAHACSVAISTIVSQQQEQSQAS